MAGAEWARLRTLDRWWPLALAAATIGAGLLFAQSLTVGAGPFRREANVFIWPAMLPYTAATALAVLWTARAFGSHLRWSMPLWSWLGRYSLGIYVLHQVALRYLGPLVREWPDPALIAALSLASLTAAAALVAVLRRSRWTAIWLGESPGGRLAPLRRAAG